MRRFVVLFLLIILPIQVLAESLTDLSQGYQCHPTEITDSGSGTAIQTPTASLAVADFSNSQQIEHADIHDSLNSAPIYSYRALQFEQWSAYRLVSQPITYLPLRKPPRL